MSKYRKHLPLTADRLFATDAGLETWLVFQQQIELPCFASFPLLQSDAGLDTLRSYYRRYADIARRNGMGLVLESPTWRANADWGRKLGYDAAALADVNRLAIGLMLELRAEVESPDMPVVISGNIGPRGDGYRASARMSASEADEYHATQIATFTATDADLVSAFTMNYSDEAIGIAAAARAQRMPLVLSFTVETDGRLPSGESLGEAIEAADAATAGYPLYYMLNCAHPTHFEAMLAEAGTWRERIRGLRANASRLSHAELDESTTLDDGDADELGGQYRVLRPLLPRLAVVGGCCGTDDRHVAAICAALTGERRLPVIASNATLR